jgi:hypothetical protein
MDKITRLDDAKAMRAMGVPLNTPVEERKWSPRAAKTNCDTNPLRSQSQWTPPDGSPLPPQREDTDLRGRTPETWVCVDCGVNTAPGLSPRVEIEAAFKAGKESIDQTINNKSEVYTVRHAVWKKAGMEPYGGCLCIGCLEKRIGRKLKPKDFPSHVFNDPLLPCTGRLRDRRGD